ncbi:hypothetical protein, partial [Salmonella sp. s55004]|uniref:hypothetical protein n=1 Tax=Salmonella sp. s55004 TaxID=3159675 RepID=UPI00397ECFA1
SQAVRPHLLWWSVSQHLLEGVPFGELRPLRTITTDASLYGWGAFSMEQIFAGVWTSQEAKLHINVLEFEAIIRAVKAMRPIPQGMSLTVFSDNTTAIAYINRQGGTRSHQLCLKAWNFLLWCHSHNILVRASHIAGKDNILADALSRGWASHGEWALAQPWADLLFSRLGRPHIDLFATFQNRKLPVFCARTFHPQAWEMDALSFPWDNIHFYAFPPFNLVHKVLHKIGASRSTGILIAPAWPKQPWFPFLLHLLVDHPIKLPVRHDLISQDKGRILHPRMKDLHLTAWKLSGIDSERRDFRMTLPVSQPSPEDLLPSELTIPELHVSRIGVLPARSLSVVHL